MEHVTHKTALSLKAAGFLPVHADLWQAWYEDSPEFDDESPEPFFIVGLTSSGYSIARENEFSKKRHIGGCVFAPTAVELLELLPPETLAGRKDGMWSVMPGNSPMVFNHRNLAEAAAMAVMALSKNNASVETCQTCHIKPATEMHTCPYATEINDCNNECNCCDDCRFQCAQDI